MDGGCCMLMLYVDVFGLLLFCYWGNIRFNFPIFISKLDSNRVKII